MPPFRPLAPCAPAPCAAPLRPRVTRALFWLACARALQPMLGGGGGSHYCMRARVFRSRRFDPIFFQGVLSLLLLLETFLFFFIQRKLPQHYTPMSRSDTYSICNVMFLCVRVRACRAVVQCVYKKKSVREEGSHLRCRQGCAPHAPRQAHETSPGPW